MIKSINVVYEDLSKWFRMGFRKNQFDDDGVEILERVIQLLYKITQNPNDILNLKVYDCPHCKSKVYLDKDKKLEMHGLLENYYCPYCGKKALGEE